MKLFLQKSIGPSPFSLALFHSPAPPLITDFRVRQKAPSTYCMGVRLRTRW